MADKFVISVEKIYRLTVVHNVNTDEEALNAFDKLQPWEFQSSEIYNEELEIIGVFPRLTGNERCIKFELSPELTSGLG